MTPPPPSAPDVVWRRRSRWCAILLSAAVCPGSVTRGADETLRPIDRKRPNVLLIVTDDQGYGDLAAHGNPYLSTPTLDRLRTESVRLEDYHVDPVCTPTRAALMTGRYCGRVGAWAVTHGRQLLHSREVTLADTFRASGYTTAMVGKWHLGDSWPYNPGGRGFDRVVCCRAGGVDEIGNPPGNDFFDDIYFRNGAAERFEGYCTDVFVGEVIETIRCVQSDESGRPFFVYLATNAMHSPFVTPETFSRRFRELGLPENRSRFYGMIENFDDNLDRLLLAVEESGQADNTIVIFMGDNGTAANSGSEGAFNAGMRGAKGSVYDGGHRVACFVRWPAQLRAGRSVDRLTSHRDWMPTLIDLCGLERPHGVEFDGRSMATLLRNPSAEWPDRTLVVERQAADPELPSQSKAAAGFPQYAVMTERWRLVNGQLYDMRADPSQSRDVADKFPEVATRLWQDYLAYYDDVYANVNDDARIVIGAPKAPIVETTVRDWRPTKGDVIWEMRQLERNDLTINGYWPLSVRAAGKYRLELARYPFENRRAIGAGEASLRVGSVELTKRLDPADAVASFDVPLPEGNCRLEGTLEDASSGAARGPYYVRITLLTD